jgi:hypothetical protein
MLRDGGQSQSEISFEMNLKLLFQNVRMKSTAQPKAGLKCSVGTDPMVRCSPIQADQLSSIEGNEVYQR